jgi:hypothetical protein
MAFLVHVAGAAMLIGLFALSSQAGYVVTLEEVGPNVVANGSGPIDLTGLTLVGSVPQAGGFFNLPPAPVLLIGPTAITPTDIYTPIAQSTGGSFGVCPGPFCTGFSADSGSGDLVGIFGGTALAVPGGYVSGSSRGNHSDATNC